eukprot:TRINITY_DN3734_c0_g1_i3.p1 TRINITY_DN3734_c0_g1~~TRINITY_DN3734_c0_g1_i3.p1  ORF type:complete len:246 (-),score=73.81 TRINITY_DN3734_c0_g1_i3:247-984(-)
MMHPGASVEDTIDGMINVDITHNLLHSFHATKQFSPFIDLDSLRQKLHGLTGSAPGLMTLECTDTRSGASFSIAPDFNSSLADAAITNGMTIKVVDNDPTSILRGMDTVGGKKTEYNLDEKQYDQRDDTFRALARKGIVQIKKKEEPTFEDEEELCKTIKIGDRCEITTQPSMPRRGVVKYVGKTDFSAGFWVGVQLDEPTGKNDGSVNGKKYFECEPNYGVFAKPAKVKTGDYPELGLDDLDEI